MLALKSSKNQCQLRKAIVWKNLVCPKEKPWFWGFRGSKLEVKIDEKSIQKWNQDGKASWHRFLMDFGGFWEPSWGQVGKENRAKTGQDRPRQRKRREAKGREGKGRGREGIGRERCGKVWNRWSFGGGGWFTRPLGGHCIGMSPP